MSIKVVILCGGKGTRLKEKTVSMPKPLIEIGGYPILWHIMKIYARHGFLDFVLCLGYKGEMIRKYFEKTAPKDWKIDFADTGEETQTGGRLKRVADRLPGETFMLTYGDGVSDLPIRDLIAFHKKHGKTGTLTAVQPLSPFGILQIETDQRVSRFVEKPQSDQWINGGFFVFQREFLEMVGEDSVLEKEPLENLAKRSNLMAYRHSGFWKCMDTYKDTMQLNEIWKQGKAPWKVW